MKKLIFLFVFALQACSSQQSLRLYDGPAIGEAQEVRFILPVEFEIVTLNQEKVAQFEQLFRNHPLTIKLAPGQHTLVLRYSDIWQIDSDNHDKLSSGLLTFSGELKAGATYRVQTPSLNTYDQAKAFIEEPEVTLASEQNQLTASYTEKSNPLVFNKDENSQQVDYPNLRQLQFWWANANAYERQQFLEWTRKAHTSE